LIADARRRLSWLRALPLLSRYITRTMPWVTLITSCLAVLAVFTLLVRVARHDQATFWLDQGTIRLSLLPAAAALAFVPYVPFRPLTRTTPVPAWVTPVGHLLLAAPVLAVTCWAQLRIMAPAIPARAPLDPHEPFYALIAQLIGWSAIIVAAAACTARSRFAGLGGAVAAPVSFAVIALAWYLPLSAKFLVKPPAIPPSIAIGWYAIAAAAVILTCAAMRDGWHRYTRGRRRSPKRHSLAS
jgi:exosortase/archaeosortase